MKYMGSKARFSKEILPIILKDRHPGQWYVEPFCGGCNVIDKVSGNRMGNDINKYLISMFKALLEGWVPSKINKVEYLDIKNNKHNYRDCVVGWVGFNCSYSGKFFGGFAGKVKTRDGTIRDYQEEANRNTLKQIKQIQKGQLLFLFNLQYQQLPIPPRSLIYCDPPYRKTTKYSTDFDHVAFWNWVRNMSLNDHTVFVSEYEAPDDFECVWEKEAKSSLSANGKCGGNKISVEKLFKLKA